MGVWERGGGDIRSPARPRDEKGHRGALVVFLSLCRSFGAKGRSGLSL